MTINGDGVFDQFVAKWQTWTTQIPPVLARQAPGLITRLLDLASREGGIFQSELRRELKINQPRLSKLVRKLRKLRWVSVKKSKTDTRFSIVTTTAIGREGIARAKAALAECPAAEEADPAASLGFLQLSTSTRRKWTKP
jgi:DNA-binding MarR family transcriptional regulator